MAQQTPCKSYLSQMLALVQREKAEREALRLKSIAPLAAHSDIHNVARGRKQIINHQWLDFEMTSRVAFRGTCSSLVDTDTFPHGDHACGVTSLWIPLATIVRSNSVSRSLVSLADANVTFTDFTALLPATNCAADLLSFSAKVITSK
ncbi:cytochrome b-c1 complex subunit 7-2-like protein [Tanacetum coccineum]